MSKKTRYLLIVLGLVFFLIAAPLIVFFVSGLKYDFGQRKFVATGILTLETEPKDAEVYLNEQPIKVSSGEIRFLKPGEYSLALKKNGYFAWQKTLAVESGKVTSANPPEGKIYLLKNSAFKELQKNVIDFVAWEKGLLAIKDQTLLTSASWDLGKAKSFNLTKTVDKILPSEDFKFFLLIKEPTLAVPANVLLFDSASEKILDLSSLYKNYEKLPQFGFSETHRLFELQNQSLYEVEPVNLTRQLVLPKIKNFYIRGQTLYYLSENGENSAMGSLDLDFGQTALLLTSLPKITEGKIFVNAQKRVFLIADNALYTASTEGFKKLAENLTFWEGDGPGQTLAYVSAGELWYVDSQARTFFITRMSGGLKLPKVFPSLDFAFYVTENKLAALELDGLGKQNSYDLYLGKNITKHQISQSTGQILILDDGRLGLLSIK